MDSIINNLSNLAMGTLCKGIDMNISANIWDYNKYLLSYLGPTRTFVSNKNGIEYSPVVYSGNGWSNGNITSTYSSARSNLRSYTTFSTNSSLGITNYSYTVSSSNRSSSNRSYIAYTSENGNSIMHKTYIFTIKPTADNSNTSSNARCIFALYPEYTSTGKRVSFEIDASNNKLNIYSNEKRYYNHHEL